MPNYKQVEQLLKERKPFKHTDSMHAEIDGDTYKIYSYRTLIASYNFETEKWWIDDTRYSVTTSKQQNIVRRAAAVPQPAIPFP